MNTHFRRSIMIAFAAVFLAAAGSQALAQTVFGDKLGFVPINPANRDNIKGTGWVRATLNGRTLVVEGEFSNLSSPITNAHVHLAPRGFNGPVAFPLQFTVGGTSGTLSGTFELNDDQLAQLLAINLYVNVHSELSPSGEIRGWLVPIE